MNRLSVSSDKVSIFLIGFSGSGKSSVAPILARELKCAHFDTDALIENRAGRSIASIFESDGEATFRKMERDIVSDLCADRTLKVVALGGGAFMSDENRRCVNAAGISIYLSCGLRQLYLRLSSFDDRPLLSGSTKSGCKLSQVMKEKIKHLYSIRRSTYRLADMTISTSARDPEQVAEEIIRRLRRRYGHPAP